MTRDRASIEFVNPFDEFDRGGPTPAQVIALPLAANEWASLRAPFPLSERKWKQMLAVLEAMKPALVQDGEQSPSDSAPSV